MLNNKILLFFLLIISFHISCQKANYALQRNDNDYALYKDDKYCEQIKLPRSISSRIRSELVKIKKSMYPVELDDYYTHLIAVNDSINLYILSIESFILSEKHIFLLNKKTNRIEKANFVIDSKWSQNGEDGFDEKLMDLPNIKITNFMNQILVTFKERVHNGNSYNAVVQKFYILDPNKLNMTLNYCIESRAIGYDNVLIERLIEGNKVKVYKREKNNIIEIGSFVLSEDKSSIVSRECKEDYYCPQLVTSSGIDDNLIIKEGYTFKY